MTRLFWFETTAKLNAIENNRDSVPTLAPEVSPTLRFQDWVTAVLSTTQVSQNVILLALMFIYRLKKFNSAVKGRSGSEFRLLTIALLLGSKCERWSSVQLCALRWADQVSSSGRQYVHQQDMGQSLGDISAGDSYYGSRIPQQRSVQPLCFKGRME